MYAIIVIILCNNNNSELLTYKKCMAFKNFFTHTCRRLVFWYFALKHTILRRNINTRKTTSNFFYGKVSLSGDVFLVSTYLPEGPSHALICVQQ